MKTCQPAVLFQSLGIWLALGWVVCIPAFADLSSPFYRVERERLRGGESLRLDSVLFSLEGGGVDFIGNSEMQGTQFKVEAGDVNSIEAHLPRLQTLNPSDFTKFFMEDSLSYEVTAQDPDGGSLEYQLRQDGVVKVPFQASSTLTCNLTGDDLGRHTYKIETRDSDGTMAVLREAYVLRKPLK